MSSPSSLPRLSFAQSKEIASLPNLIELQKRSYEAFLQEDIDPQKRGDVGLQSIFKNFFPIKSFSGHAQLEFSHYTLEEPKYDALEARRKGATFAAPLRVAFRLVVWSVDEETGNRSIESIKEQDVYMGDVPLMTENATFVINGVERVVVSQMHRSPGVFFDHDRGRTHVSGKHLFSASVRPFRGSWLDFEFDAKDMLYVRIDKKRKFPVTTLLMALSQTDGPTGVLLQEGFSREEILRRFYECLTYTFEGDKVTCDFVPEFWRAVKLSEPLIDGETGEELMPKGKKITNVVLKKLEERGLQTLRVSRDDLIGRYLARDYVDEGTGEVYAESGDEITQELLETLLKTGLNQIEVLHIDHVRRGGYLRDVLMADRNSTRQEALFEIYRILRPGDPPTFESAAELFYGLFFDPERYDLSAVGRVKMNARLGTDLPDSCHVLSKEDIFGIVRILLDLRDGRGAVDDIDSLSNRRVRAVGEMLSGQYQLGLLRLERSIQERMSNLDIEDLVPQNVLNAKPLTAILRDFFGSSQLSQFMDQTNPLSEITHKRRLSALGPGGLAKDRASIEVRDVHPTHYGRVCPVETPEGQSIGLINSMASYARVNHHGFIETPYACVKDGRVTDEVVYLSAINEGKYIIAQGNAPRAEDGTLTEDLVSCRKAGEYTLIPPDKIDFIDVSPKQILSVAAALIPFVENDDASRALMGANMQRQAVPLLKPQAPLIGTGMERVVAKDSGCVVMARRSGVVSRVDATRVVVLVDLEEKEFSEGVESNVDIYTLSKFQKTNHGTCMNQRPVVQEGDRVDVGQVLADGPSTDKGELALGRNVTVAFLPWNGYGFEDSIIVSERLVEDDAYTSVHIEEYEVCARDTKLGSEEITRDIPGINEEMLRRLDESGIVYVGAEVKAGDILVGKVTPKGDNPMTSEEKLLRAIFGEKAVDMRDTSLKMPSGARGTVVDVRVFSRRGMETDERSLAIRNMEVQRFVKERDIEKEALEYGLKAQLSALAKDQLLAEGVNKLAKGETLSLDLLSKLPLAHLMKISLKDKSVDAQVRAVCSHFETLFGHLNARFEKKVDRIRRGDDLPAGVLKTVRVFVAVKRKLQTGDKMAGRHGNKGVVSKVLPVEDMPYLEDGTPVDMVLNPLGVPSRMNVGQVFETNLGWATKGLGQRVCSFLEAQTKKDDFDFEALRALIKEFYALSPRKEILARIESASEEELLAWALSFAQGVPMMSPVFEGARVKSINKALELAGLDVSGQSVLYDGRTGKAFERKVTVGVLYMLKLHHLIDEKMHARSVGPYSLITQQPLGGKSNLGGQRLGEMEVWALEGYGAAYTLREMLTIKSDDTEGRTEAYGSIVTGNKRFSCGIPASFNVLVKELRALGLNMEFLSESEAKAYAERSELEMEPKAHVEREG